MSTHAGCCGASGPEPREEMREVCGWRRPAGLRWLLRGEKELLGGMAALQVGFFGGGLILGSVGQDPLAFLFNMVLTSSWVFAGGSF